MCAAEQATKAVCEADGADIDGVFASGVWCPAPSGGNGTVQPDEPGVTSCSQVQAYCDVDAYAALVQESCPATCGACPGCASGANGTLTVLNTEAEICAGVACEQAECCQPQQRCSESAFSGNDGCAAGANPARTQFDAEAEICVGAACRQAECCKMQCGPGFGVVPGPAPRGARCEACTVNTFR